MFNALQKVLIEQERRLIPVSGNPLLPLYVFRQGDIAGLVMEIYADTSVNPWYVQGFDASIKTDGGKTTFKVIPTSKAFAPIFSAMAERLLRNTTGCSSPESVADAVEDTLHDFKLFFSPKTGFLTKTQIKLLIANLSFIVKLVEHGNTFEMIMKRWFMPYGGRAFILNDDQEVHIRATAPSSKQLKIFSEDELADWGRDLILNTLPVELRDKSFEGSTPFIDLYAYVDQLAESDPSLAQAWKTALHALGFDPREEYYRQFYFSIGPWTSYSVSGNFPRLTKEDLPPGVDNITYHLQTTTLEKFRTDVDLTFKCK